MDEVTIEERNYQIDLEAYRVARDTRNFEIELFWKRSNYFLVLSTAAAAGFFSLHEPRYALPLATLGFIVSLLWIAVNLGSKFWQSRWEHRLHLTEQQLRPNMNLFSAPWEVVRDDVLQSFKFQEHGRVYRFYTRLVITKPSVSFLMTLLSLAFAGFWAWMLATTVVSELLHK